MELQLSTNFNVLETDSLYEIDGGISRNDLLGVFASGCYIGGFLALPFGGPGATLTLWGVGATVIDGMH